MDQLKTELVRKCQVCHLQSQDIQKLRKQAKEAEVLFIENDSLTVSIYESAVHGTRYIVAEVSDYNLTYE